MLIKINGEDADIPEGSTIKDAIEISNFQMLLIRKAVSFVLSKGKARYKAMSSNIR